jgi:hypothetical protein
MYSNCSKFQENIIENKHVPFFFKGGKKTQNIHSKIVSKKYVLLVLYQLIQNLNDPNKLFK